jgi:hypothetical protein
VSDLKSWYLSLPDSSKQVFLAVVAHQLTVHGRYAFYALSGEQQIRELQGLNELQHQISSHIAAIGLNRERYSDEVLWEILQEKAKHYQISPHLAQSLQFAKSRNLV